MNTVHTSQRNAWLLWVRCMYVHVLVNSIARTGNVTTALDESGLTATSTLRSLVTTEKHKVSGGSRALPLTFI